jgi:hypothetical protein
MYGVEVRIFKNAGNPIKAQKQPDRTVETVSVHQYKLIMSQYNCYAYVRYGSFYKGINTTPSEHRSKSPHPLILKGANIL